MAPRRKPSALPIVAVGCVALLLGTGVLAASFAFLGMTGGPPARPAPTPEAPEAEPTPGSLAVGGFAFRNEAGAVVPGTFAAGTPIRYRFDITGLTPSAEGEWSVIVDLQVAAPSGVRIVEGTVIKDRNTRPGAVAVAGIVELSPWVPRGDYTMTFKIE